MKAIQTVVGLLTVSCMVGCASTYPYYEESCQAPVYSGQTCDRPMPPPGLGFYRSDYNYVPKPRPVIVPGGGYIMTPYPVLYTSPVVRTLEEW